MISSSLTTALTGLQASQTELDVSANNVANLQTPGFKASTVVQTSAPVQTYLAAALNQPIGLQVGQGTQISAVSQSYASGGMVETGYPSDLSINGAGFFEVVAPSGETYFTRNGDFVRDSQGFLRTPEGAFLSAGGSAVKIPPQATQYEVGTSGQVSVSFPNGMSLLVGQLDIATFPNESGLLNEGGGIFKPTSASGMPAYQVAGTNGAGTVLQGYLEVSNVDVASEMVNQILALRNFQANAKVVRVAEEESKTLLASF